MTPEINKTNLDFATTISKKMLLAQKEGGFYALTEKEATEKMVAGLNESLQKQSYQQIEKVPW